MEHPHLLSGTYITSKLDLDRALALYSHHSTDKGRVYGRLALSEGVIRQEQLLNWATAINPRFWPLTVRAGLQKVDQACRMIGRSMMIGDIKDCSRHLRFLVPFLFNDLTPAVGRKMIGLLKKRILNSLLPSRKVGVFLLQHMSEQAPNPSSRVTLADDLDCLGQRRVRLDWQLSAIDIRTLIRGQQIVDEELRRAGLGRLEIEMEKEVPPPDLHGGWHHMGTTRMHSDPKLGVVNEHCLVHGMNNLFIAGPSTFPTSGYANPTLTIVALAIRLADHIKRLMAPPSLTTSAR
jgi:choline dehydrogenase-like flavoprotein